MYSQDYRHIVHDYYWNYDLNCATTIIKILSQQYTVNIEEQVIDGLIGMHGAGKYGAQCGLVEGALVFIGIYGKIKNLKTDDIIELCYEYAQKFEERFGSLRCDELRPDGFHADQPAHLCETMTNEAVKFAVNYMEDSF